MMKSTINCWVRGLKNAIKLIGSGKWSEFILRLRITLGQIDLKNDASETVTDRTHYYVDSSGLDFDKIMANFDINNEDAIVDYGCGKGGALISLSKYPFSKITGVEISPEIVEIAKNNLEKLKIKGIDIVCGDAEHFKDIDSYNYFYFFNPFPRKVMDGVISNIKKSIQSRPRKITIIYLHPFYHEAIEAAGCFIKTQELPHFGYKCFVYTNSG